ncbi:conjugal transfer protein [Tessaracoccus sp. MC1679]|uniref:conjugal transfer protein n=1 Tax=Tessaracoccus sp. MC1679 TaxID=2760313 RepID=UPI0015FEEE30|nr:conjugal transfer protein [Tessaracoccus sp. MC1679]MBB1517388.1 conjugal transfer protein [Tessaracoccus sp. MC1679]
MKLLNTRKAVGQAPVEDQAPVKIAASNWTRGQQLATSAARVVLWGLVACAPLGVAVGAVALTAATRPAAESAAAATPEPDGRSEATGVAEHAVTTWLEATRSGNPQHDGLAPAADLPTKALEVSDPGAVESRWEDGAWVVTVGVTVTSTTPATDQISEPVTVARRRYFQVPVAVDAAGQVSVLTLPAEVAGPTLTPAPSSGYRSTVPPAHPASVAAGDFLAALLAGAGDITRYTAPGAEIRAVTPAPYIEVIVESVAAADAPSEDPVEGATVVLLVRARAQDATGAVTRFDYVLSMAVRSSRWEITQIKGAPQPEEEVSAADSAPSVSSTNQ